MFIFLDSRFFFFWSGEILIWIEKFCLNKLRMSFFSEWRIFYSTREYIFEVTKLLLEDFNRVNNSFLDCCVLFSIDYRSMGLLSTRVLFPKAFEKFTYQTNRKCIQAQANRILRYSYFDKLTIYLIFGNWNLIKCSKMYF